MYIYVYVYICQFSFSRTICVTAENTCSWPMLFRPTRLLQGKNIRESYFFLTVCGCSQFEACVYFGGTRYEDTWCVLMPTLTVKTQNHDCRSAQFGLAGFDIYLQPANLNLVPCVIKHMSAHARRKR